MNKFLWLGALSLNLLGATVFAEGAADLFSYDGFGTAGLARTDTNDAIYAEMPQSVGATRNFDYKTDSKLALQVSVTPTAWLSGTAQALSQQTTGPDFLTRFEWAFVKIKPLSGLSIRGGRLYLPTFLASDSRNVGYSNTWLRAPLEVYGQAVFTTYNGYDVTYERTVGPWSLNVSALAGSTVNLAIAPIGAAWLRGRNLRGVNATLDMNFLSIRLSHVKTDVDLQLNQALLMKSFYTFDSVGAVYDRGSILVQGEFIERKTGSDEVNIHGLYVLGGYHWGKWTPYALYAADRNPGGFGRGPQGSVSLPQANEHTVSGGIRVDVASSLDIKLQFDHVDTFPNGAPFTRVQPGFDHRADVLSIAADFVF